MDSLQLELATVEQGRVQNFLEKLISDPPRSLLLESGSLVERRALALYWAAAVNCQSELPPCLQCSICNQVRANVFRDLLLVDGSEQSISVDMVREIRAELGQSPAGKGLRVIILLEAQSLNAAAANALLKSMEEPAPGNIFVLTAPQRENLLPTLVSRSLVLTLSRKKQFQPSSEDLQLAQDILDFSKLGQNLFEKTMQKDAIDKKLAQKTILALEHGLLQSLVGQADSKLAVFFQSFDTYSRKRFELIFSKAQNCLAANANPALVIDWTAVQIFTLCHP